MNEPVSPSPPILPPPDDATARRGQPRARVSSRGRGPAVIAIAAAATVAMVAVGGWWAGHDGRLEGALNRARWDLVALSTRFGFTVDEIQVTGRRHTPPEDLLEAVRLARGAPMLTIEPETVRRRVAALPWVREAVVERRLPDTVFLRLIERQPVALWQSDGHHHLIDREGVVIAGATLDGFRHLPVVVGDDAPSHVADLLTVLATDARLAPRVRAAVWVGGRRWTLRLDTGIDVQLPEDAPAAALAWLSEMDHRHQLLDRDVRVFDLRLPDRLIVRMTPRDEPDPVLPGRQT